MFGSTLSQCPHLTFTPPVSYDEDQEMKADDRTEDPREYPCLLRVSDGGNVKFSTTVSFILNLLVSISMLRSAFLSSVSRSILHNFQSSTKLTELFSNLP